MTIEGRFRYRIVDGWTGHRNQISTASKRSALAKMFADRGWVVGLRVDVDGVIYEYLGDVEDGAA